MRGYNAKEKLWLLFTPHPASCILHLASCSPASSPTFINFISLNHLLESLYQSFSRPCMRFIALGSMAGIIAYIPGICCMDPLIMA